MKGSIQEYLTLLTKVSSATCSKGMTPQSECIIIDNNSIIAFDGDSYIEAEVEDTGIECIVNYARVASFFKAVSNETTFTMKLKNNQLILVCGKLKQKITVENENLNRAADYGEELHDLEWYELGGSFNETLAQKKYAHHDCNNVMFNIAYTAGGVLTSDGNRIYLNTDNPFDNDDILLPVNIANILSRSSHPFTDFSITDNKLVFMDEKKTIFAFTRKLEEYPEVISTMVHAPSNGILLDLGDSELKSYIEASSIIAEKHRTGESLFTLVYDENRLKIKSGTDSGASFYSLDVHTDETVTLKLTEGVLLDIIELGSDFRYDKAVNRININSSNFIYIAITIPVED